VRTQIIVVVALIADSLRCGLLAGLWIVLFVPLLEIGVSQTAGKAIARATTWEKWNACYLTTITFDWIES
jgi:hypothetical protein